MTDSYQVDDRLEAHETVSEVPAGSRLAAVFQRHNTSLVRFLRARLKSDQEARDVAQEAYVRLLQLDRAGTVSYLRTYLFRTALNLATDRMRSTALRGAIHRDPIFDLGVNEISPERVMSAEDDIQAVRKALEHLPPRQRYVFLLHRFADLDIDEIAQRLAISERMVRAHLAKAMIRCREAIDAARATSPDDGDAP